MCMGIHLEILEALQMEWMETNCQLAYEQCERNQRNYEHKQNSTHLIFTFINNLFFSNYYSGLSN